MFMYIHCVIFDMADIGRSMVKVRDKDVKGTKDNGDLVVDVEVWALPRASDEDIEAEITEEVKSIEGAVSVVDIGDPIPIGLGLFRKSYIVVIDRN